jgi:hydrogenase maturation protein HypF
MGLAEDIIQSKFTDKEWALYRKMAGMDDHLQSSSVGRLFDALASLLGICDKQTYEGEAALLIETMARRYFSMHGYGFSECYIMPGEQLHSVSTEELFSGVVKDIKQGRPIDFIAAKFHYSLVVLVISMAESMTVGKIVFSGGVFQNTVLIDLLHWHVGDRLELYFHKELPSNDENLSFGQMVYYDNDIDGCCSALVGRAHLEAVK